MNVPTNNWGLQHAVDDVAALLRSSADVLPGRRLDRLIGTMLRTVDGFAQGWESATSADVWRSFAYDGVGEFLLRRTKFETMPTSVHLILSYDAGRSHLAERALAQVSVRAELGAR